ncbi:hypothetical protein CLAFUW4_05116 [Fulvia fulva]|uniref:Uncharacterized protein n=1 Tax=Passalora fulva TaxID=5499 RepID=A0A9Q8PH62_PASFU|nr:uncharacterized protein CLAFUR5_11790 [Fulvia fulva]KAK4626748.1 hypothetical protein CLAFUR4_05102 [Fulvia fulva]KAK4628086.1 hypothetical protein CLAFUR0_05107 [Fulvia fulva]UJO22574.1 hypothetical protein CLAFUR5_11790 [Fulvia fulva]WPV13541.1 hypothetical protein CLAFUW4_05116 [Fulvia fulva]WPV28753.1 hypothetical protein CLAFUW7_05111 [Fulvia fulva]
MKSFIAAASLAALAAASPVPQAGTTEPLRFGGLALRSASPIHFGSINANSGALYIGKNTTTYCPEDSVAGSTGACTSANTNQTIFSYLNGQGTLSLSTMVPGGQQVYVTVGDEATGQLAGQLKFTPAHSAMTSGPALTEGFAIAYDAKFQFEGQDWFACPVDEFNSGYGIWSVARVGGSNAGEGCLGFTWRVVQVGDETASAWQYQ